MVGCCNGLTSGQLLAVLRGYNNINDADCCALYLTCAIFVDLAVFMSVFEILKMEARSTQTSKPIQQSVYPHIKLSLIIYKGQLSLK